MKIAAGRGLPVMDRSSDSTDAFVEVLHSIYLSVHPSVHPLTRQYKNKDDQPAWFSS